MLVYIDVVGTCNLHCPLCPMGAGLIPRSNVKMDVPLFDSITDKILAENKNENLYVGLYNWTEPFLHPELDSLCANMAEKDLSFTISSNFALPNLAPMLAKVFSHATRMFSFAVSISGFTQEVYGKYHRGGKIETVKENIRALAETVRRSQTRAYVAVKYLQFAYNHAEIPLAEDFAKRLGLNFFTTPCGDIRIPELIASFERGEVPSSDYVDEKLMASQLANYQSGVHVNTPCSYQSKNLCIDARGECYLCCITPYSENFHIGNYLELTQDEIFAKLRRHGFCNSCKRTGLQGHE